MLAATLGLVGQFQATSCLKTSGQTVRRRRHATEAMAAAPRVALWRRHAVSECMDGTPRPTATPARFARRLRRHTLTGWRRCHVQPGTQRRVAAARLARQRTPRSELIAATIIQRRHIHDRISD